MLNSEPQTYVITSETVKIVVLLSDLSKLRDVRTLPFVKKEHQLKKTFLKKDKKGQQFFQGGARAPVAPSLSYATGLY